MEQPAYTVVVAEDEELLLHNLVEKIHRTGLGFHVAATAQTGLQAYEAVKEHNPDLLVTDIRMPVMNGIELLEKVRNHYPLTRFIITSGFSDFEYAKCYPLRVCEYLLKPLIRKNFAQPFWKSAASLKWNAVNTQIFLMMK